MVSEPSLTDCLLQSHFRVTNLRLGRPLSDRLLVFAGTAPVALEQCASWFAHSDPTHDDLKPCEQVALSSPNPHDPHLILILT